MHIQRLKTKQKNPNINKLSDHVKVPCTSQTDS